MDDPGITMKKYIRLKTEKALKKGKVYNLETATYGKIMFDKDVHFLRSGKTEFPAIVYNDALTYELELSCEPMVSPQHIDKVNWKIEILLFNCDDENYTVIYNNDSFSYKIFNVNDLKLDIENLLQEMDDPGITMKKYIRLKTEKALKKGKVYNLETAMYGKISLLPATSTTSNLPSVTSTTTNLPLGTSTTSNLPPATSFTSQLPLETSATSNLPSATSLTSQLPSATSLTSHLPPATSLTKAEIEELDDVTMNEEVEGNVNLELVPGGTTYWEPNVDEPYLLLEGKRFDTIEKCAEFYSVYAEKGGFEVKKWAQKKTKSGLVKSKKMPQAKKMFIVRASTMRLGATKAHNLYSKMKGGTQYVHGTSDEFKNHIRDVNAFLGESDAQMLINKMENRKNFVPNFTFQYLVENSELVAMFWADEVAKCNYKDFGDIISFDATF
nr:hypothetical protein [Tanacetum cinerariifolium]